MKKNGLIIVGIVLLGIVMYGLTLRGAPGNPTADQFKDNLDQATNAFELSPERGRYVHVANMAESGVYNLSRTWADIAAPDVGISSDGAYSSFFAPGVSYFILPFYLFGARYGLGQATAFAAESLVSIVTLVFVFLIGTQIFALPRWAAFFAVLTYGFASTSWSYAITLYQNAFTAMFMVTAFYAAWRFAQNNSRYSWLYAAYIWLAYALAIFVDYPNVVLMLPVMVYLAVSTFTVEKVREGVAVSVRWSAIVTCIIFAFVTGLHFWHNATYYGGWSHLAGELRGYTQNIASVPVKEKTAAGFFHEYAVPNGLSVLLFGDERGLFFFSPLFLFSLLGIFHILRKNAKERSPYIVPLALVAINVFLYSSWGDPWGGWAYGPRYLIASMPWLALFVGVALSHGRFFRLKKAVAFILFLFSSAVALLGALTSNAVPPKSEAVLLPIKTYNFLHSIPFLRDSRSSSFVYKTYVRVHSNLSLAGYLILICAALALIAAVTLFLSHNNRHE